MAFNMDPHLFNINSANELRLRRHIRDVLLPYARVHLTSDHVAFTEKAVEELLLQTLEYVPMADATSFFLPTNPFELLIRFLDSLDLTPPEERWVAPSGHVRYLRTLFPPLNPHDLRTEICWHEEDDRYAKISLMCRPMSSPVLSKRARRETRKIGGADYQASIPRSNSTLKAYLDLDTVSVQSIEDSPTPPTDDVLDLRYRLDHATSIHARPLLQSILAPSAPAKLVHCSPNVPEFLTDESPPRCLPSLYSPPLFPRVAPQRRSAQKCVWDDMNNGTNNLTRLPDLVSMLQKASPELIDGEDGDINSHHMEVVSGRSTLTLSSPPPRSSHSSDVSEVGELWNITPPGTPATSLMAAKMDEVEIPRIRKFGYKNTLADERANQSGADLLTVAKSLGFFITSFISAPTPMAQAPISIASQLEGVKSGMHSPHPLPPGQKASNSLLGQPPSISEEQACEKTSAGADFVEDLGTQQFDDAVASIYVSTPQDPLCYIREEKLEEKDIMLMDVPNLPPPTAHPREPILCPEGMQTFVAPTSELGGLGAASHGSNGLGITSFLKPVKGIKPLALDLSWRPFNFGKMIPTDEDVAGVATSIQPEDEVPGYRDEKYEEKIRMLLDLATPPTSAEEVQSTFILYTPRGCDEFGTSPAPARKAEDDNIEYLLTHRERLRASNAKFLLDAEAQPEVDGDTEHRIAPLSHGDGHEDIPDEGETLSHHEKQGELRDSFDLAEYYCAPSHDHPFDDSGISIVDNIVGRFSTDGFLAPHLLHPPQDALEGNNENIDTQSEDKENVPPWDVNDYQPVANQPDSPADQYDWSRYFEFPESPFKPLSFPSQSQLLESSDDLANSMVQNLPPPSPSNGRTKRPEHELGSTGEHEQTSSRLTKRRKLDDLVPASAKDLFSTFIGLRKQVPPSTIQLSETQNDTPIHYQTPDVHEQIAPRAVPDDLFDQHTVRLPEDWVPSAAIHRYLVSMNVIQKRALVRELQGHHCRVILVERSDLGGTDIIVDPDFGVLFMQLLALPANINSAVERISGESWRYSNLFVIFEAFPSTKSYRADRSQDSRPVLYAYTPPICKAIKKLRRNLGIAEGCGTMNPECRVTWAFADDVQEAARLVRCFGEEVGAMSAERHYGLQWDNREWLEEEEREGESMLAAVPGMNAFAAFVMLYNRSLDAILELSPEARLAEFGPLLGKERMIGLNGVIDNRSRQISPDITDCVVDPGQ